MRLIRCRVENFGKLHHYMIDFDRDLTVIQEANGAGKSTLAAFICAMFYGFPRANKNLTKDYRHKYLPWQGGRFGGNLEFEFEGKKYRIDRTFGERPNLDTFNLYDAETLQKSTRFSKDIGIELFGLDADSFERSTYMPQQHDQTGFSTVGIQAKLNNLVDDTNDISNFDKAVEALRKKRTTFQAYRGTGGEVYLAKSKISDLQLQIEACEKDRADTEKMNQEIDRLETDLNVQQDAIRLLREKLVRASDAAARQTMQQQYENLLKQKDSLVETINKIHEQYPKGVPQESDLQQLETALDTLAAMPAESVDSQSWRQTQAFLDANRERFRTGIPSDERIVQYQRKHRDYIMRVSERNNKSLSSAEKQQLQQYETFFVNGLLSDDELRQCSLSLQTLTELHGRTDAQALSQAELERKKRLDAIFQDGLPSEKDILQKQQLLGKTERLQQENATLLSEVASEGPLSRSAKALPAVFIAAGLILLLGSIWLIFFLHTPAGGIVAGLGAIFFVVGGWLFLRGNKSGSSTEKGGMTSTSAKRTIEKNKEEIEDLERQIEAFLQQFGVEANGQSQKYKLEILARDRTEYLKLRERSEASQQTQQDVSRKKEAANRQLQQVLGRYPLQGLDATQALTQLRTNLQLYRELRRKQQGLNAESKALLGEIQAYERELTDFLSPYFDDVVPSKFDDLLAHLRDDANSMRRALQNEKEYIDDTSRQKEKRQHNLDTVNRIFEKYAILGIPQTRIGLQQMKLDRLQLLSTEQQLEKTNEKIQEIVTQAPSVTQKQDDSDLLDRESLSRAIRNKQDLIDSMSTELVKKKQNVSALQVRAEALPVLQDELETWQEKYTHGQQCAETLDKTIEYLRQAKESLSGTYLARIERGFTTYIQKLLPLIKSDDIHLSPDLDVTFEQYGTPRALEYFSAGYVDVVTICMRFALVDALFGDSKPFVILDDPFVNLDDEVMKRARILLEELGQEHQIIYMVCNSSRC